MTRDEHSVTLPLNSDTHFVLTAALAEWASRQRDIAQHDPDSADSRHEWVATADQLREHIEGAL